ncbi:MAG: hypothetical protein HYV27_22655 [Candidatus Hydrogenedentes bacterium]|nr:hypothetical protein [Candidatus Hydrogenedentota bacterium]
MNTFRDTLWAGIAGMCFCALCHAAGPAGKAGFEAPPPEWLSAYDLFADLARQIPSDGVMPYDLSALLFSDYAVKHRFVWMPPGTSATYQDYDVFEFPVGTILVKTFAFPRDARRPEEGEQLVETRLLVRTKATWKMYPYVWNEQGTDARLALAGARVPVRWVHTDGAVRSMQFNVPNVNQCKHCHIGGGAPLPAGPKARYLNMDYAYPAGAENQLVYWIRTGRLTGLADPATAPKAPDWDDPNSGTLDERARTYLDINCAHCHSPGGLAYTSGLDLRFDQTTPMRYGVLKSPVAAGRGASIGQYDIVPGDPDKSILLYRLTTTDPGVRMPTVGRSLEHDEGVELIREWIADMAAPKQTN